MVTTIATNTTKQGKVTNLNTKESFTVFTAKKS